MNNTTSNLDALTLPSAADYAYVVVGGSTPPDALAIGRPKDNVSSVDVVIDEPIHEAWADRFFSVIAELAELQDGWNGEDSHAIEQTSIEDALDFLVQHAHKLTPPPSVVPTNSGGIQLEWHQDKIDMEVEFEPGMWPQVYFKDIRSGRVFEGYLDQMGEVVDTMLTFLKPTYVPARA